MISLFIAPSRVCSAWLLSTVRVLVARVTGFRCRVANADVYSASSGCCRCDSKPTASHEFECICYSKWKLPARTINGHWTPFATSTKRRRDFLRRLIQDGRKLMMNTMPFGIAASATATPLHRNSPGARVARNQ